MASKAVSQSELIERVSADTGYSKSDIKHVLTSLDAVIASALASAEKVKVGQLVQLEVKIRPAQKKRTGRNPRTGEAVQIAAKPATPVVRARVLKKAKEATPTLARARKLLFT